MQLIYNKFAHLLLYIMNIDCKESRNKFQKNSRILYNIFRMEANVIHFGFTKIMKF